MKQKLDERQIQEATKIASISFYVMYGVCALAIILQLIVTGHLENVIGETAVIAAGGIVYLSGSVKKGLSRENSPSPLRSLFESTVFSALFTVFYVFAIRRKAGPEAKISTAVLLFFTGITVLCFFTLRLMNFMTERKHRQQEQKYLDEE